MITMITILVFIEGEKQFKKLTHKTTSAKECENISASLNPTILSLLK